MGVSVSVSVGVGTVRRGGMREVGRRGVNLVV